VGHLVINRNETKVCGCGKRGCVEQYCSATGIVRITKEYLQADTTPSRMRQIENLTCKDVFDCANEGDKIAETIETLNSVSAAEIKALLAAAEEVINGSVKSGADDEVIDALNAAIEGLKTAGATKYAKVIEKCEQAVKALNSYTVKK
jgi:glucokinase